MAELTEFQTRFLAMLEKLPNGHSSTSELAKRLRTSRVAVVSAGRALKRAGKAVSWRYGDDQWAVQMWAARTPGVEEVPVADLTIKSGPFKGKPQQWFTRAEVIALLHGPGQVNEGWKEAAIAWNVCASVHLEWAKGKDALFKTRQADYLRHHEDARARALGVEEVGRG